MRSGCWFVGGRVGREGVCVDRGGKEGRGKGKGKGEVGIKEAN